jgi:hypothetical protein
MGTGDAVRWVQRLKPDSETGAHRYADTLHGPQLICEIKAGT